MTVTLNKKEILNRAYGFMKEFAAADYEMGQAQNFIRELCKVFGLSHLRLVNFEQRVKKLGGGRGRIDGFYPGKLLIEMKSRGEDLDAAYIQATEYLHGLKDEELPEYILVSDFAALRLYRPVTAIQTRFAVTACKTSPNTSTPTCSLPATRPRPRPSRSRSTKPPRARLPRCTTPCAMAATPAPTWSATWCGCCFACLPTTRVFSKPTAPFHAMCVSTPRLTEPTSTASSRTSLTP